MIQNNYYSKGKTKVRYNTNLQHACKLIIIHGNYWKGEERGTSRQTNIVPLRVTYDTKLEILI